VSHELLGKDLQAVILSIFSTEDETDGKAGDSVPDSARSEMILALNNT
jgi:hypothetical protein